LIAFTSNAPDLVPGDDNNQPDVFVHDRLTLLTTRVSVASDGTQGTDISASATISVSGRFVAFSSSSPNLVPGDGNGQPDVFVHDLRTGLTTRASVATDGTEADAWCPQSALSSDGRVVAFLSYASTLVDGDTNGFGDIFVRVP